MPKKTETTSEMISRIANQDETKKPDVRLFSDDKNADVRASDKEEIIQRILATQEALDINLPENIDELKNWLIDRQNILARETARLGFGFLALKEQIEHGEFTAWLESNDLKPRRVQEMMSIASMLLNAPDSVRPKLMGCPKSKLMELAKLSEESIYEVGESGELDELTMLSVRELREQIRALKTDKVNLEANIGTEQAKVTKLQNQLALRQEETGYPDFYLLAREEGHVLTDKALTSLDDLEKLARETITIYHESHGKSEEYKYYATSASASLFCHIKAATARFVALTQQMHDDLPESITGPLQDEQVYTQDELEQSRSRRKAMVQDHIEEANLREDARRAKKPRGRGRPAKSSSQH